MVLYKKPPLPKQIDWRKFQDKTIIRLMISRLQSMEQKKLMAHELLAAQNAVALQVKEMFATVKII